MSRCSSCVRSAARGSAPSTGAGARRGARPRGRRAGGDMKRLQDRVAAVTGGASGIGEAICVRLAEEGATVAVLDLDLAGAQLTADLAGAGIAVELDVSDSAAM